MTPAQQYAAALKVKRVRKYRNTPTEVDGVKYDSKREAKRHAELKLLQDAKKIHRLRMQPSFPLVVNNFPVCKYVADFDYYEWDGTHVIEDVKSPATRKNPVYRLKVKLLYALTGESVREV